MNLNCAWTKIWTAGFILGITLFANITNGIEITGPVFINEPKGEVEIVGKREGHVACSAYGDPSPVIQWYFRQIHGEENEEPVKDNEHVSVRKNGTLIFKLSRSGANLQQGALKYICRASNQHGSIVSTPVTVRFISSNAGGQQWHSAQVYDEHVIAGNTALLKCHMPTFYSHQLFVKAWIREDNLIVKANETRQNMVVTSNGNLHINDVTEDADLKLAYWCQVSDRITGQTTLSETSGKLRLRSTSGHHQQGRPTIRDIIPEVSVMEGEEIELVCLAAGVPTPRYKWYCDDTGQSNKQIQEACLNPGSSTVTKTKIDKAGTYVYTCAAHNTYGKDIKTTTIVVRAKLQAFIEPNFQVINNGNDAILDCKISGYPVVEIKWMMNGKSFIPSNISDHKIKIKNFDRDNVGMYQCFVKNKWESVQASAQIALGDAVPTFLKTFRSRTMQPGPSISLKCKANGRPIPDIIWRFNGGILKKNGKVLIRETKKEDGTVGSSLVVKNVRKNDGGEYSCEAKNRISSVMHVEDINVYGLPYVHDIPDVTVAAEQDVFLRCYVSGYPIQSIEWSRIDGYGYLPSNVKDYGNGSLRLQSVQDNKDEGTYRCRASNGRGQHSEKTTNLKILIKPTIGPSVPEFRLQAGKPFSTFCSVINGDEPVTISWLKNNKSIELGVGTDISTTKMYSVLQIRQVSDIHTGNYTCLAQNKVGRDTNTVRLQVLVSPKWTTKPNDTVAGIGAHVVFPCKAAGFPSPRIQWFKVKGKRLEKFIRGESRHEIAGNGSLILKEVKKPDEGKYSCVVSNDIAPDLIQEVSLIIGEKPSISFINETSLTKPGQTIALHCYSASISPKMSWYRNSRKISSDQRRLVNFTTEVSKSTLVLLIKNATHEDSGDYKCVIRNRYGEMHSKTSVYVSAEGETNAKKFETTTVMVKKSTIPVAMSTEFPKTYNGMTNGHIGTTQKDPPKKKIKLKTDTTSSTKRKKKNSKAKSNKKSSTSSSDIFNSKFDMTHILFIIPVVVIVVLLIAIIITLVIYLSTRRHNPNPRSAPRMSVDQRSNKGTLDRSSAKGFYSDGTYRDNRYGRLERPPGMLPSSNRSSAAYEIPDYYAGGSRAYATLQPSSRQLPIQPTPHQNQFINAQSSL